MELAYDCFSSLIFKPLFPTRILFQLIPYVSFCELDNLINRVNGAQRPSPIWSISQLATPKLPNHLFDFVCQEGFYFEFPFNN